MSLDIDTSALSSAMAETAFRPEKIEDATQGWQHAGERMLLFLKRLALTPEEQLGLALEAIRRARQRREPQTEPVSACMQALWQIMQERCALPAAADTDIRACQSGWEPPKLHTIFITAQEVSEHVLPPMRRQRMISAPMELAPWRQTITGAVVSLRKPVEVLLYRYGSLLGALVMLLICIALI